MLTLFIRIVKFKAQFCAVGTVNSFAQIRFAASGRAKSTGNIRILGACLQMHHIHVFLVAPLGSGYVSEPSANQHQR
jgi:hypothetical protein